MKIHPVPVIAAMLLLTLSASAQLTPPQRETEQKFSLLLKNGSVIPEKNITAEKIAEVDRKSVKTGGKSFLVIQFEKIPTASEKKQLQEAGVELLDYIPNNAYTVTVTGSLNNTLLAQVKARAVIALTPEQKMQPALAKGIYPAWAVKVGGTVDVWISFPKTFSFETISNELKTRNIDIISNLYINYRVIALRISAARLKELASLPFIEYVQAAPNEDQPINNKSTVNARANILSSTLPGGRNLRGEGVVIGIGDNSNPLNHIDFSNRIINRSSAAGGAHGLHVMGTAGGAGIIDERRTGFAPKATIIKQYFSGILAYAPAYVQDHGMVITNNSYGNNETDCATFGIYDLYSRIMDQQAYQLPNLQTVFATGNSGSYNCGPYPAGFSNVLGSYQTAKNVINVGATTELGVLAGFSSKGPVRDGRIKPEITAQGALVYSTWPTNIYSSNNGSSMAAPAVSGGLALLYQRYRQLHSNNDPKNGLMKALLCNGAEDKGNPGPDYSFGFGWMNLQRSVKMMEDSAYVNDAVANSITNTHSITVPANTARLKVMLYWNDPAAAVLASQALVNDLDLEVRNPSMVLTLPQLLDTVPANVTNNATTGADHINNIEQVVINNPAAGTYTISVIGTAVTENPEQEYFLVYDIIPVSTELTYPVGNEKFHQNTDSVYISWGSYGNPANDFTVQYSNNNGGSWTTVPNGANVAANLRQLKWFVPNDATTQAKIKLIHNGTGLESISDSFTIVGVPIDSLLTVQCEGYIGLGWRTVTGATDYEVLLLRGDEMVPVATTAGNSYIINGLSKDSVYWVTVRARINGVPGRRAYALSRQPNTGTCTGSISDNDLKIDALLAPASGRVLTSSALTSTTIISVRIKNLDDNTINNFNVKYSVDGAPFVSEAATNIAGGATYPHNFAATYDFSTVGSYELRVVVENTSATDPVSANDTLTVIIKQLPNGQITLVTNTNEFLDDLEAADDSAYYRGQIGLSGADRYDFKSNTAYGRLRAFINSGIAYSGNKALTLDADRYVAGGTADSLIATFNLLPHFNTLDDIRLDFVYKNHNQVPDNANRVWIRGDDAKPWVEVYNLYNNQDDPGSYKKTTSIELSDILAANAQDFSTSFQVRFGQWGQIITADDLGGAGYTFDDIHLYKVDNDAQMVSLDTPVVASCGLGAAVPVRVTVRNNADTTINNIPVSFTIDGGSVTTEMIGSVAANTNASFTFTGTANLSIPGIHIVKVWVDYADDSFRDNDTVTVTIVNSQIIAAYPHIENFESNNGGWYSGGTKSSWQYGTPASPKINRAASGSNAWKTNLTGSHNDKEISYLYSPCYDITGLTNPTLSFSIALDLEDCADADPADDPDELCDGAYMEYSADGVIWTKLGAKGQGTNWYNKAHPGNHLWSVQDYTRWHVATIPLPTGYNRLRLRFVMTSDPFVNREGIAVDDIHVYDNVYGIYDGPPYTSNTINQAAVSGSGWFDFVDGGKLIASVNPNGQNLGSTNARTYINTSAVRTNSGQYYHDRNITIKPATRSLADSATVRFYFLDTETEDLITATGCPGCDKPSMAYELGVSKYNDADTSKENGTLADNAAPGDWLFIVPANVTKVPFDKGYYAEFKVKDFSEFWLNTGGLGNNQSLPAELLSFTAKKKTNKDVVAEWKTASELNVTRYEIELAKGNEEFQHNRFIKIGEVSSNGNSSTEQRYIFTDIESNKSGVRYYRLKIIDLDGRFTYSAVRPVVFDDEVKWQVYPNPSQGLFNFVYQVNDGENVQAKLYDINGKLVQQIRLAANGFVQKHSIDLQSPQFTSGLYLLEVMAGEKKQVFRLIKQ